MTTGRINQVTTFQAGTLLQSRKKDPFAIVPQLIKIVTTRQGVRHHGINLYQVFLSAISICIPQYFSVLTRRDHQQVALYSLGPTNFRRRSPCLVRHRS
jgi:uncharacterized protein with PQ loop repeat